MGSTISDTLSTRVRRRVVKEENGRDWVEEEEEDVEHCNLFPDRTDLGLFENDMTDDDRYQEEEGEDVEDSDQVIAAPKQNTTL
ncbi:hypothetical protein TorRG33x02_233450 [Trema orientale]|uniref:Uncharacterized protein n=1 Tax=Trema orientale TaxID=63057 RepID=A0A2P5E5N6_TREOI|nr:hypothetical protein TorRG33x02_233450 [Trema orientale]